MVFSRMLIGFVDGRGVDGGMDFPSGETTSLTSNAGLSGSGEES